jgi:hypothetical protein
MATSEQWQTHLLDSVYMFSLHASAGQPDSRRQDRNVVLSDSVLPFFFLLIHPSVVYYIKIDIRAAVNHKKF